jgi:hypothetical protein
MLLCRTARARPAWIAVARARLGRFDDTPHAVAFGLSAGVFAAFLPIFGLQMLWAALLARLARASIGAAILGTFIGNPLTWPMMWGGSYWVGAVLLGTGGELSSEELGEALQRLWVASAQTMPEVIEASRVALWSVLKPLTLGSIVLGLTTAALFYYIARRIMEVRRARP